MASLGTECRENHLQRFICTQPRFGSLLFLPGYKNLRKDMPRQQETGGKETFFCIFLYFLSSGVYLEF